MRDACVDLGRGQQGGPARPRLRLLAPMIDMAERLAAGIDYVRVDVIAHPLSLNLDVMPVWRPNL